MPKDRVTGSQPVVLLVEDDRALAGEICLALQARGLLVNHVETASEGLLAARNGQAAVLIVDRGLNGEDGLAIVTTLRAEGSPLPTLVISGLSAVEERIDGLQAGGDDYLAKPFEIRELSARVEALLRRISDHRPTRLRAGPLEMDLVDRQVRRDGEVVNLLPREFKLLESFMRRPGQTVTRAMLLDEVWNYKFMAQTNVVDVQIGNLRRKLDSGDGRRFIVNVRAIGFMLNVEG